jgi:hypothetical protein
MPVADAYNPNYLGGWVQEDSGLRPVQTNSSRETNLQNNHSKIGVAQAVECLLWKSKALSSNSSPINKGMSEQVNE